MDGHLTSGSWLNPGVTVVRSGPKPRLPHEETP